MHRFICILLLAAGLLPAGSKATGSLNAYLNWATFNNAQGQSYFETYLTVSGHSIIFTKNPDNKFQSKVNIVAIFTQGNDTIKFNNYNLRSTEIDDTTKNKPDVIDVERYWLKKGVYTLQLTLKDVNNPVGRALSVKQKVNVGFDMDSVRISDVEFLQSYTVSQNKGILDKRGYDMVPYVFTTYPEELNQIKFYSEVYNGYKMVGPHQKFIVKYFIESAVTEVKITDFSVTSVQMADTVNPILGGFNIADLPSGAYRLRVEVRDKDNNLKATRAFNFWRHNPFAEMSMKSLAAVSIANTFVAKMNNEDTLIEYIHYLTPIANYSEKDFAESKELERNDITLLRQYFYNFWLSRSPNNPEGEWNRYLVQVLAVNRTFATHNLKGYQTDRGRVYLHYGAPNQKVKSDMTPTTLPYEIWEYYKLPDGQIDAKFVFYNPDLVTNDFVLIHSTARGELNNGAWQLMLNSTWGQPGSVDQMNLPDPYGENTLDNYNNPR